MPDHIWEQALPLPVNTTDFCKLPCAPCPHAEVEWAVPDYIWEVPPLRQPGGSAAGGSAAGGSRASGRSSGAGSSSGSAPRAAGGRARRRMAQAGTWEPNDPYYQDGSQWHLPAISAPEAWALSGGAAVSWVWVCC